MKPAFLQDAIKANALKKIQKRDRGEWKEPVIKQHKMTAEEFAAAKQAEKPRSYAAASSPMMGGAVSTGPDPTTMKLLETVQYDLRTCKNENQLLRTELNKSKDEVSTMRNEIKNCVEENKKLRSEVSKINDILQGLLRDSKNTSSQSSTPIYSSSASSVDSEGLKVAQAELRRLNLEVSSLRDDLKDVQKENSKLKETITTISKESSKTDDLTRKIRSDVTSLRDDLNAVQNENNTLKEKIVSVSKAAAASKSNDVVVTKEIPITTTTSLQRSKTPEPKRASVTASAPVTPTAKKSSTSTATSVKSPTKTPKKEEERSSSSSTSNVASGTGNVHIEPFTAEKLEYHQRKDESFQHYIKTKEGLYPMKDMSVASVDTYRIVQFYKKVYIPIKLREKVIVHYENTYGIMAGTDKLKENCIWPDMDSDIQKYRQ